MRSSTCVAAPVEGVLVPTAPSASPLAVAIDGAGFFAVESAGTTVFTRLGDFRVLKGKLVDGAGRAVLGFTHGSGDEHATLAPITIGDQNGVDIAADGTVTAASKKGSEAIGKIALAIFPAPELLARADDTTVKPTRAAGTPRYAHPGAPNVGSLKAHVLENALVDVGGDLAAMWREQRRADGIAAAAGADDACDRDVLGLVK